MRGLGEFKIRDVPPEGNPTRGTTYIISMGGNQMDFPSLFVTVVLVSASGVLAPGPLFFANITFGSQRGFLAGIASSTGHLTVELPLIILLALGLVSVGNEKFVQETVSIVGGMTLLLYSIMQIISIYRHGGKVDTKQLKFFRNPYITGLTFTIFNPFFIIWWLTIGSKLIVDALLLASFAGVFSMFISHIWMDYVWLSVTAHLANKGKVLMGSRGHKALLYVFSTVTIYFGLQFILVAIITA